ncbi:hypothetical protein BDW22DRAFT_1331809 [Trametopsis cervina]|nr:hypothetical protein BDW22DRAFT_1331809 [Trametopsis cervina]
MNVLPAGGKIDLRPKRRHGFSVVLFIFGTLFPPLAVAARFGVGADFWLNLVLTLAGYIPGHVHNFYIQNIRNNKNHQRTPKWIQRYGLVDTSEIKRKERRSQWASRYNERNPHSTLADQALEDGQEGSSSVDLSNEGDGSRQRSAGGEYWNPNEERYYSQDRGSTHGSASERWHYPANFEDTVVETTNKKSKKKKEKKEKKDRWARTEDAYSINESGTSRKKKLKKRKSTGDGLGEDTYSRRSGSTNDFPEDPEGGLYGNSNSRPGPAQENGRTDADDIFSHQL